MSIDSTVRTCVDGQLELGLAKITCKPVEPTYCITDWKNRESGLCGYSQASNTRFDIETLAKCVFTVFYVKRTYKMYMYVH